MKNIFQFVIYLILIILLIQNIDKIFDILQGAIDWVYYKIA